MGITKKNDPKGWIWLYGPNNELAGTIGFHDEEALKEKKTRLDSVGIPRGQMCFVVMLTVMDLLRNEGPIYVHWVDAMQQMWIDTAPEPVGEEEM